MKIWLLLPAAVGLMAGMDWLLKKFFPAWSAKPTPWEEAERDGD